MPRAVFVDPNKHFYDRHGLYAMSAALKQAGFDVDFVCNRRPTRMLKRVADLKPDHILYSCYSAAIGFFRDFDRDAKKLVRADSLIGGPGPTFNQKCLEGTTIDAACIGEGDHSLIPYLQGDLGGARNIFRRNDAPPAEYHPLADLDKLPFPDRDAVYSADPLLRDMPSKQFLSGRGCPYRCSYCFNHSFRDMFKGCGAWVRKKSVDYLLEEIRLVRDRYPLVNVVFNDDTFILNQKWFFEFAERFPKEIGLPYTCNIRANLVDEPVIEALKKSGCSGATWSIESGSDFIRNEVLKRGMSAEQIRTTARLLKRQKIPFRIGNVLALPGETFEQALETLEMNIEAAPSVVVANIFVPFPGLQLTKFAIEKGYYEPRPDEELPRSFTAPSALKMDPAEGRRIRKLAILFPTFVSFPALYRNGLTRAFLFALPPLLLRVLYETLYTFNMMRLFVGRASMSHRIRMARRYILNFLFGS
ncbi:B12-binding domain-containing radical SAM protein [Elusimicrobiota bacterium]